jgi:hypothetical protein
VFTPLLDFVLSAAERAESAQPLRGMAMICVSLNFDFRSVLAA